MERAELMAMMAELSLSGMPRRARAPPMDSLDKGFCNQKNGWILDADAGWLFEAN